MNKVNDSTASMMNCWGKNKRNPTKQLNDSWTFFNHYRVLFLKTNLKTALFDEI